MILLAKLNKTIKLFPIRYVVYTPNRFYYEELNSISLLVEFMGDVYRLDYIKRGTEITRDLVYSAIEKKYRTWITKFETFDTHVEKCGKDINGGSGCIIGEIEKIK